MPESHFRVLSELVTMTKSRRNIASRSLKTIASDSGRIVVGSDRPAIKPFTASQGSRCSTLRNFTGRAAEQAGARWQTGRVSAWHRSEDHENSAARNHDRPGTHESVLHDHTSKSAVRARRVEVFVARPHRIEHDSGATRAQQSGTPLC